MSKIFNTIKERFQNFDNYRWGIFFTLVIAASLLTALLLLGDLSASQWFIELIVIPSFVARLVSGGTYLARIRDMLSVKKQSDTNYAVDTLFKSNANTSRNIGNWEKRLSILGIILGITVAAIAIVFHASVPLLGSLGGFGYVIYTLGFIGILAGIGNRLGFCFDKTRDKSERIIVAVMTTLGLALAIALMASSSISLTAIAGVTPFIIGASFPPALAAVLFTFIMVSVFTSAADYLGKSWCYLRATRGDPNMNAKKHEYLGALVGVGLGLAIGSIVIACLPALFTGIGGIAVGGTVLLTCVGVLGGLSSRVGRFLDGATPYEYSRLEDVANGGKSPSDLKSAAAAGQQSGASWNYSRYLPCGLFGKSVRNAPEEKGALMSAAPTATT